MSGVWVDRRNAGALGRVGGLLRYQVLLTLLALAILRLGAGHGNICGVGAVIQQVMEGVQVIRLRLGWKQREERQMGGERKGRKGEEKD